MKSALLRRIALSLPLLALAAAPADAHRRWLLPSATVLSGESETLTVDAAVSNGLFYFEHVAAGLEDLTITGPDGKPVAANIIGKGAYRSTFDVPLKQQGTYRVALASDGVFGAYMLNGERKRWRGSAAEAKTAIPAGATDIQLTPVSSRVETFVTLGAPNDAALAATGRGLEMVPVTHPNDLVTGEDAQFSFLIDGKPAAGLDIEVTAGGTRYRDEAGTRHFTTDADGLVTVRADAPGFYYLEASPAGEARPEGPMAGAPAGERPQGPPPGGRRLSYAAVLEFLPS